MISPTHRKRLLLALWDSAGWVIACTLVIVVRYDFALDSRHWLAIISFLAVVVVLQTTFGALLKVYLGRYRVGSFDEVAGLAITTGAAAFVAGVAVFATFGPTAFPRGLAILGPPTAFLVMASGRWVYRSMRRLPTRADVDADVENILIYGAGDAGEQLVRLLQMDSTSPFRAVGLIDDDPGKRNLRISGVGVVGDRSDLVERARKLDVSAIIMAISAASPTLIREVSAEVERADLRFMLLPPVGAMIGGRVSLADVRELDISDLLGRRQVDTDVASIADYITGRRVLVTGAGGSIGSELARQVHTFGPSDLALLDRDESALHAVQISIYGKGLLDTPDMVLADIRDKAAMREVFETHRPEVVFHAAALKHLPMLEQYPEEGWKTNVLGTANVLELASEFDVTRVVNVSTDKAADATSVLGRTKRVAERLTAWYGERAVGTYISVRFGNVLGSRGSMLHTFRAQIEAGGPVTVTHPEVTRYFMTIPEASQLVIQAGAIGEDGSVLVLDMGDPVRILDVAERLIAHSGKKIDIVYTGLRPNEKLHEVLVGSGELDARPYHPLISHVRVPGLDPDGLSTVREATTESPAAVHPEGSRGVADGRRSAPASAVLNPRENGVDVS